jgi:hypothetical protein
MSFEKTSDEEWMCATRCLEGWSDGLHIWRVRLDRHAEAISVGISQDAIDFTNSHNNIPYRFDLFCGNGRVIDPRNKGKNMFPQGSIQDGDIIVVRLDLREDSTLTFDVIRNDKKIDNGKSVTITKLTWYPYFALRDKNAKFTILSE